MRSKQIRDRYEVFTVRYVNLECNLAFFVLGCNVFDFPQHTSVQSSILFRIIGLNVYFYISSNYCDDNPKTDKDIARCVQV